MFLVYGGDEELAVKGYVDASFDSDLDDSKSQTGYVYMLNGGAVSWCSCKQSIMAGSTCEAEYMAASEAAHEAIWMKEFITDLGVIPNASGPMTLFCDNTDDLERSDVSRSKLPVDTEATSTFHRRDAEVNMISDLESQITVLTIIVALLTGLGCLEVITNDFAHFFCLCD